MVRLCLKLITLPLLFLIFSCDRIEYSPNQIFDSKSPTDLNKKQLEILYQKEKESSSDTIRFILTGDTQRAYDQAVHLVREANKIKDLDFVLLNGDISDFGLLQEMKWISSIYQDLNVPFITIIGNHDLVANGMQVYQKMFGELNFNFTYKGVKFICHDANSREYQFNGSIPDINWLSEQLKEENNLNVEGIIGISHIPPRSYDFDPNLRKEYEELFNSNSKVIACLHSHENVSETFYPFPDSIPFIVTNAVQNREFLYVEIVNGKMIKHENVIY